MAMEKKALEKVAMEKKALEKVAMEKKAPGEKALEKITLEEAAMTIFWKLWQSGCWVCMYVIDQDKH